MQSSDPNYALRINYHIGNYQQVLADTTPVPADHERSSHWALERRALNYRARIALRQYDHVITDIQATDPDVFQAIRLLAVYLDAGKAQANEQARLRSVSQLEALSGDDAGYYTAMVMLHERRFGDALDWLGKGQGRTLDRATLKIQILTAMNRIDLATTELDTLKSWAEDAIQAQLSEAFLLLSHESQPKWTQAFHLFYDLLQTHGATPKLQNGMAVAKMRLGKYGDAERILGEVFKENQTDSDTLANLFVCANHLNRPLDVIGNYIKQFSQSDTNHPLLLDMHHQNQVFDRAARVYQDMVPNVGSAGAI